MNWLDTVRTLTDMGVARDAIADVKYAVDVLEQLKFEPACESEVHNEGIFGHSGDAEFFMDGPCEHTTGLRCSGYVDLLLELHAQDPVKRFSCAYCGNITTIRELRFIPITPRSTP